MSGVSHNMKFLFFCFTLFILLCIRSECIAARRTSVFKLFVCSGKSTRRTPHGSKKTTAIRTDHRITTYFRITIFAKKLRLFIHRINLNRHTRLNTHSFCRTNGQMYRLLGEERLVHRFFQYLGMYLFSVYRSDKNLYR